MKKTLVLLLFGSLASASNPAIDACLRAWKTTPFKKGTDNFRSLSAKVKVMGIGANINDVKETKKPELILVKPGVTVLSKQKLHLLNPNGWYCLQGSVAVLGKSEIDVHCNAKLASSADGVAVLGDKDDEQGGVAVLGKIEVNRIGCQQ